MKIVSLDNVSKTYNNNNISVQALKNINLSVEKGEFVAIVGPSGSGKSTLLHLLGALEKPTSGKIIINNKDLSTLNQKQLSEFRRKEIGFVFQKFNLIPILNSKDNIMLPLLIGNETVDEKYLNYLINFLGITNRQYHMPSELSGGQQQRVAIARALIAKPSIILADEPTGNLDQKSSEEIVNYFVNLSKEYTQTIIMITHNLEIAQKADRIIHIIDGICS